MQGVVDGIWTIVETYNGDASTHGYTNAAFPSVNTQVLTAAYYDSYDFVTPLVYGGSTSLEILIRMLSGFLFGVFGGERYI